METAKKIDARMELRAELHSLVSRFHLSSMSQEIRTELSDTIAAVYVAGHIGRAEYQEMQAYVR